MHVCSRSPRAGRVVVTSELAAKWVAAARGPQSSLGAMRQLARAYRLACHYGDNADQVGAVGSAVAMVALLLPRLPARYRTREASDKA